MKFFMRIASLVAALVGGKFWTHSLTFFCGVGSFTFTDLGSLPGSLVLAPWRDGKVLTSCLLLPHHPWYTLVYQYHCSFNMSWCKTLNTVFDSSSGGGVLGVLGRARPLPHCSPWMHAFHICLAVLWLVVLEQLWWMKGGGEAPLNVSTASCYLTTLLAFSCKRGAQSLSLALFPFHTLTCWSLSHCEDSFGALPWVCHL